MEYSKLTLMAPPTRPTADSHPVFLHFRVRSSVSFRHACRIFNSLGYEKASPGKVPTHRNTHGGEQQGLRRPFDEIPECRDGISISLSTSWRLTQAGSRVLRRTPRKTLDPLLRSVLFNLFHFWLLSALMVICSVIPSGRSDGAVLGGECVFWNEMYDISMRRAEERARRGLVHVRNEWGKSRAGSVKLIFWHVSW